MIVLEYLFVELRFNRVWAKTQSNNIFSIKALEKCGFTREGSMRDYYLSTKGVRSDAALLSILSDEFYVSVELERI
jgi:[ribosomal protein S5]-alanine N-acetyltransferase